MGPAGAAAAAVPTAIPPLTAHLPAHPTPHAGTHFASPPTAQLPAWLFAQSHTRRSNTALETLGDLLEDGKEDGLPDDEKPLIHDSSPSPGASSRNGKLEREV